MSAYIYGIKNKKNNLYYIGQTINKSTRKWRHFDDLRKQTHPNKHLQNSFNKNGEENFLFEILEKVEDYSRIKEREDYWIEKLGYYNIDKGRTGFTPSALRNMSQAQIGKISPRRILSKEDVFVFMSIEEFIGNFGRPFSRIYNCNRIVPREILSGICYQDVSKEYLGLSLENRVACLFDSLEKVSVSTDILTNKTASCVWFLYKNKQKNKKDIALILKKDIRSIERILKKETLKDSYEIYSELSEEILEIILKIVIGNTVPSSNLV